MLERIWKHRRDMLNPRLVLEHALCLLRVHIAPYKETASFVDIDRSPEMYVKTKSVITGLQPKQVAVTEDGKIALISCMQGKKLQIFDTSSLFLKKEIKMPEQCVEVVVKGGLALATTSNFAREGKLHNQFHVVDIAKGKILSSVDTQGNWSKFISITPDGKQAMISNWQSNSISVIDIENPQNPRVSQIIELRKCPRGIAFTHNGEVAIVANFYSGNIAELRREDKLWKTCYISEPFDNPHYSGNPRHVLVSADDQYAYISNVGRNLVHVWSISQRKFLHSYSVGKEPNTIEFANNKKNKILVSCRKSDRICLLDIETGKISGVSPKTGRNTTGLCTISETEFLATGFDSNTLEKFSLITHP